MLRQVFDGVQKAAGPCKIFVGSLPDGCPEDILREELLRATLNLSVYEMFDDSCLR